MKSNYFKSKSRTPFQIIVNEKQSIEKTFECLKCSIDRSILICKGVVQPTTQSVFYTIRLKYDGSHRPTVHIIDPVLPYDRKAHMFKDKSLCLYYPKEQPWSNNLSISQTIIPWTAEWLVYYELYQYYGKWLGPEVDHGNNEKIKD